MLKSRSSWKPAVIVPSGNYRRLVPSLTGGFSLVVFLQAQFFTKHSEAVDHLVGDGMSKTDAEAYIESLPVVHPLF